MEDLAVGGNVSKIDHWEEMKEVLKAQVGLGN